MKTMKFTITHFRDQEAVEELRQRLLLHLIEKAHGECWGRESVQAMENPEALATLRLRQDERTAMGLMWTSTRTMAVKKMDLFLAEGTGIELAQVMIDAVLTKVNEKCPGESETIFVQK